MVTEQQNFNTRRDPPPHGLGARSAGGGGSSSLSYYSMALSGNGYQGAVQ